jgi:hypothetical protein
VATGQTTPLVYDSDQTRRISEWVRMMLRDFPELNRLTEGYDHSPRHVYWAILATLSDWASTPPFIGQDLNMILNHGWDALFCRGVVIELLQSLGILHTRNYLAYSDGGVNVQTENPQLLQSWLQMFKNEYEQKKLRCLVALNIENALGTGSHGVHSEYAFVNSFFGAV